MAKNKEMRESAKAPYNRIDDTPPGRGRVGIGTDNPDEVHPRAIGSDKMALGSAVAKGADPIGWNSNSVQENDSNSNQTMGIP